MIEIDENSGKYFLIIEKLSLQVPWSAIYAQPTKVTIEGLYLLVVPKIEVDYDEKREAKELHDTKMREVLKIEQLRKKKEEAGDTETNNSSLIEKLQLQVLRNLELTIENIHIVYEDRTTKADRPFSFGITLDYFTLHVKSSLFSTSSSIGTCFRWFRQPAKIGSPPF